MDSASVAKIDHHRITNAHFNFRVDLDAKYIDGFVKYDVECLESGKNMCLDADDLEIKEITVDGDRVDWTTKQREPCTLGSYIEFPVKNSSPNCEVVIKFLTGKKCSALQWIPAESTSDKKKPFFFSQLQPINARSLYPCQDTPSVKFTYTAEVHAPDDINVLVAAVRSKEPCACSDHSKCKVYHYEQKVPIPSYLFAIAGGELVGKKIGPRSTVWAEPSLVDAAAEEFSECEKMLAAAEELCGKYEWGVYDVLVPPPTFPFGGMENPCLTYVTPTIIAGDKSLVNVIAHEISHSWTGNLVTNDNWENFWLNEGHTNYLERIIMGKLQGPGMRELFISIGYEELRESVHSFGLDHEFTKLVPKLDGVHPDDAYSRVPYEKGSLLLYHLETIYGQEKMLMWLKAYLKEFYGKSLSTQQWLDFLKLHLGDDVEKRVDLKTWLYKSGMPPMEPPKNHLIEDCEKASALCQDGDKFAQSEEKQAEFKKLFDAFATKQKEYFFRLCWYLDEPLTHSVLDKLEEMYHFSTSKNSRIRLGWSILCVKAHHSDYLDSVFEFINSQGVMKFVRPIYKALRDWPEMKSEAIKNFNKQRPTMYPTTAKMVAGDLGLE